jgi:hypothetical protein
MGCFSGSSSGMETKKVKSLTKSQRQLVNEFVKSVLPAVHGVTGATIPGMEFAPPGPSDLQAQAFGLAGQMPAIFEGGIQGMMEPVGQYARQGFQQETIPAIMGALGAEDMAESSEAARILGREGRNLELGLASRFAPWQMGLNQMQMQAPGIMTGLGTQQRGIGQEQTQFGLQRFMAGRPQADPRLGFIGPAFTSAYDTAVQPGAYSQGMGTQLSTLAAALMLGTSDERLKDNIEHIENALEKIKRLDGKTYNFKATPDDRDAGLIAQDIEKVLPEAVIEKDGIKYVKYQSVVALLVNAVNELARKVG